MDIRDFTLAEALLAVAICASAADKKLSQEELDRALYIATGHALFTHHDMESLQELADRLLNVILSIGVAEMLEKAEKILTPALKETAFAWAVDVVQAHEGVATSEESFLDELVTAFGLDTRIVKKIIEVTEIRNRGTE